MKTTSVVELYDAPGAKLVEQCAECRRSEWPLKRKLHGQGYCPACYERLFKARPCAECGASARVHRNITRALCNRCQRTNRCCLRCGKATPRAALMVGEQVLCASCAPYYRTKAPCDRCGTLSSELTTIRGFEGEGRLCLHCRAKILAATCSHCGKHRTIALMSLARAPICRTCLAHPESEHACPDCGEIVGGVGAGPCLRCAVARSLQRKVAILATTLTQPVLQALLSDFVAWAQRTQRASRLTSRFDRYAGCLLTLDSMWTSDTRGVDDALMRTHFPVETLRRFGLFTQFLADQGHLLADNRERARWSASRRLRLLRDGYAGERWAAEMDGFAATLAAVDPPLSDRSQCAYLRAALNLARHGQLYSLSQLQQQHVDGYLKHTPGQRANLFAILRYLRATYSLHVDIRPRAKRPASFKTIAKALESTVETMARTTSQSQADSLLADAIARAYGVQLGDVLCLTLAEVGTGDGDLRLRLKGTWLDVDVRLAPALRGLVGRRREPGERSARLFPGRNGNDMLSVSASRARQRKAAAPQAE